MITLGDTIQKKIMDVTIRSTCTKTLIVSSSNLPEWVTISFDNKQIFDEGVPSSDLVVSFDYSIILNQADYEFILVGTTTVENNTYTNS